MLQAAADAQPEEDADEDDDEGSARSDFRCGAVMSDGRLSFVNVLIDNS